MPSPPTPTSLLGDLSLAAAGLPQLLAQVGRWLAAALAAGRLGCDDGTDPAAAVSGAWLFMSDARASAAALARDLEQARQQIAAVNGAPHTEDTRRGILMIDAVIDQVRPHPHAVRP